MRSPNFAQVRPVFALGIIAALGACAGMSTGHVKPLRPDHRVITADEIEKSGATDAWEVLRKAGTYLSFRESYSGAPVRMSRRGRSSIYLDETPVVIVDGVRLIDFRALQQIRAQAILTVRILTGVQATAWHGNGAGGGAIVIETKSGPE